MEEKKRSQATASERLPSPAKILALPGCTFMASKPAIFGVEILLGRLKKGVRLMDRNGSVIGEIREMQKEGKGVNEARRGEQLAISVEGAICGKSFSEMDFLYAYITGKEGGELAESMGKDMPEEERQALAEILAITDKKLI